MEFDTHSILGYSTIASIVSQTETVFTVRVKSNEGQRFGSNQQVIICPANTQPIFSNSMVARITAILGDQLTIDYTSGNREGTSIRSIQIGDQIINAITPKVFADLESVAHAHSNKSLLDTYDQTNVNITDAVAKKHSHSNSTALNAVSGINTGDQDLSPYMTIATTLPLAIALG